MKEDIILKFAVPENISKGISSGQYIRYGGVILENSSRKVVHWLKPGEVITDISKGPKLWGLSSLLCGAQWLQLASIESQIKAIAEQLDTIHNILDAQTESEITVAFGQMEDSYMYKREINYDTIDRLRKAQSITESQLNSCIKTIIQCDDDCCHWSTYIWLILPGGAAVAHSIKCKKAIKYREILKKLWERYIIIISGKIAAFSLLKDKSKKISINDLNDEIKNALRKYLPFVLELKGGKELNNDWQKNTVLHSKLLTMISELNWKNLETVDFSNMPCILSTNGWYDRIKLIKRETFHIKFFCDELHMEYEQIQKKMSEE